MLGLDVMVGEIGWDQPAGSRVRSVIIVVVAPFDRLDADLMQGGDKGLDLLIVSKPAVATFDEPIFHRLTPG